MTDDARVRRRRRGFVPGFRLGLRARVAAGFGIGALLVSLSMSGLVLGITRTNLVSQREANATQQLYFNARNLRSSVVNAGNARASGGQSTNTLQALQSLQTPEGSRPVLFLESAVIPGQPNSGWTAADPENGRAALPEPLRAAVTGGMPAKMRFNHPTTGHLTLAVGVPIADLDGAYFEIVSLRSLDDTLTSISFTLFGASIITVFFGAWLGWYASRRILRPLGEVADAARSLAGGDLDARIETLVDPDLEPIITSFNGMASALEARIAKDAQFASDVSHELRSPLMTLQASLEVLDNNRDQLSERGQAALDLLAADVDRFQSLVEDLLEISRFDAGVMDLELTEILLTDFVSGTVRSAGFDIPVVRSESVVVPEEYGDVLTAVDPRRLARVLTNLLTNAAKYADGPVRVTIDADADSVRICIDDHGPGVPPEDRQRIFERFNRAGAAGRRGQDSGVGLGLALVDEHVALHGGRVWVEDAPGGGARFVIELPRVELEDEDQGGQQP